MRQFIARLFQPKFAYLLLLFCIAGWLFAAIMPAYWAAQGEIVWAWFIRRSFSPICHQLPSRCFTLWGEPLALCTRCIGIYGGMLIGLIIYPLVRAYRCVDLPPGSFLLFALLPMGLDYLLNFLGLFANTPISRSLTGALAGIALAFYLVPAIVCLIVDLADVLGRGADTIIASRK
ncbi:MAG: DUF2085 domain-containing protein [Acidobacteriota bacterium]